MVDFNKLNRHVEIMNMVKQMDHDTKGDFDERAAIRQYDGNQSIYDAEIGAWEDLQRMGVVE